MSNNCFSFSQSAFSALASSSTSEGDAEEGVELKRCDRKELSLTNDSKRISMDSFDMNTLYSASVPSL